MGEGGCGDDEGKGEGAALIGLLAYATHKRRRHTRCYQSILPAPSTRKQPAGSKEAPHGKNLSLIQHERAQGHLCYRTSTFTKLVRHLPSVVLELTLTVPTLTVPHFPNVVARR